MRDAGRARLGRIRPFQGIHPTTTLAQELHILATANTSLGPGAGGFPHGQLPGKVGHRPVPLASLCCFTVLCQIRFSDAACLSLLSRPFLVPIPHQSHPCPAAQQALLRFLPSCRHHLDDALEQRPTQLLASLLKTLMVTAENPTASWYLCLLHCPAPSPHLLFLPHRTCLLFPSLSFTWGVSEVVKFGAFQEAVAFLHSPRQHRSGNSSCPNSNRPFPGTFCAHLAVLPQLQAGAGAPTCWVTHLLHFSFPTSFALSFSRAPSHAAV